MAAVMKPWGKKKAETQYEFMVPFSTHCLKKDILSMKSFTHEARGFSEG